MLSAIFLIGCQVPGMQKSTIIDSNERPERLVVYLSAAPHEFRKSGEQEGEDKYVLYPSKHIIGMRMVGGELNCEGGNVFAQALRDYSQQTGIDIEIHYLEEYNGQSEIMQDLYEQNKLPDLMIVNKHSMYDYYRLSEQGILLDFFDYVQTDEALQDDDQYYQNVLSGGNINQKQIALPVLFNMNGLITSRSYMEEIGVPLMSDIVTYDDVLHILEESCIEMKEGQSKEAIFEASGLMIGGQYIPSILTGAAYPSYFTKDGLNLQIKTETISSIMNLMQLYNQQEFSVDKGWEEKTYIDNLNNDKIKSRWISTLEKDNYEGVGIFLSGGRCGGINFHNSLLTDAAYFHSVYEQNGEEMVLCGIPTEEQSNVYSANISVAAVGFSTTQYPTAVYDLARYLMDYEYPTAYGFSVNRDNTEKQLDSIQTTSTTLYADGIWSSIVAKMKSKDEIENEKETINPLDANSVDRIRYMLDHIAGAGMPFGVLERSIYISLLHSTSNGMLSVSEAGEWATDRLKKYLKQREQLQPFYDEALNQQLRYGY